DGVVEGDEECDDGDDEPGDGCEPSCALTRIVKLACGAAHTCALSSGGAVRCWGLGQFAVLGYGSLETVGDDELPIDAGNVDVGTYDVVDIVAGGQHTCVRTSAGELRCWGAGAFGQLGLGSVEAIGDDEAPSTSGPTPLGGAVIQHAAMAQTGCVVLEGGALRCWGRNDGGQLGLGNTANVGDDELPTDVEPSLPWIEATRVSVGIRFACALEGGDVYCWGDAAYGQTGHGNLVTIGDNELPWPSTSAVAIGGSATQLVTGNAHACALLEGGALRCWGRNDYGQLGQAATLMIGDNEDPQDAPLSQVGGVITRIYANGGNTCALLEGGALRCWGINAESQLGVAGPPVGDNEHPGSVPPVEVGAEVVDACVGQTHVCALTAAGAARCWGDNKSGQLGYGHTQTIGDDETPAQAGDVSVF
ncbi:MAG: hypothetical protein KC468_12910, partial [Myxococcales bacterium]|nr:hypothetical protein [Myxococcales bacterium]